MKSKNIKISAFWKFFNSAPHRQKYIFPGADHPVVICAEEAWSHAVDDAVTICNAVATQAFHQGKDLAIARECARQISTILRCPPNVKSESS